MVLLSYAGAASSYAFNAASSYVFTPSERAPEASTSSARRSKARPVSLVPGRAAGLPSAPSASTSSGNANGRVHGNGRSGRNGTSEDPEKREGELLCDTICAEDELYSILGVGRRAKPEEIRRAFLSKSRICHPDKLPHYPSSTPAFQRLSYAYETLSKPQSRRLYDVGGLSVPSDPLSRAEAAANHMDETLNGVLRNVFTEFMSGDFEMIRVFVNALNESNPGLNVGEETVDSVEGMFRRLRDMLLTGHKYVRILRFELIRLYEIQHALRSLGYFDVTGRLRLTLALTRVTLEIPMVLDRAMRDEPGHSPPPGLGPAPQAKETNGHANGETQSGELASRGLLGPRVKGALVLACKVLEKGERFGL